MASSFTIIGCLSKPRDDLQIEMHIYNECHCKDLYIIKLVNTYAKISLVLQIKIVTVVAVITFSYFQR